MSAKHTPGPWRFSSHPHYRNLMRITCSSDQEDDYNLSGYCGEANARLISAAPELLDALERLLASGDVRDSADAGAMNQARAAIAKATGSES